MDVIWGKREGKCFFGQDWTGGIALIPKENFFSGVMPRHRADARPGMTVAQ